MELAGISAISFPGSEAEQAVGHILANLRRKSDVTARRRSRTMDFDDATMSESDDKVRVRFVTKVLSIRVTETPIAVPRSLRRYGLSEVINHLLGRSPPTPFDILVRDQFLRSSLRQYMERAALSGESILELEYLPALREPEEQEGATQPDWVGAIASGGAGSGFFVTGGYDGALRVYDDDCRVLLSEAAHTQPVTAVAIAAAAIGGGGSIGGQWCVTGSKDHSARLWMLMADGGIRVVAKLRGHNNSMASACFAPSGDRLATGDWDGRICLWKPPAVLPADNDVDDDAADDEVSEAAQLGKAGNTKRRKLAAGTAKKRAAAAVGAAEQVPTETFKAHAQAVSGMVWPAGGGSGGIAYTGSWDRSVKTWDVERQDCVHTVSAAKVVTCMAGSTAGGSSNGGEGASSGGGGGAAPLLATGHPDAVVRVWDPRAGAEALTLVLTKLSSHREWVSGVAWLPGSAHLLASAAQDGAVKLWDVRSTVPLHSVTAHAGSKALCVAWHGARVLSGGADGAIKCFAVPDATVASAS
ncbi:unnamed protein product [Phaeothamnion confervicola]